MKKNIVMLLMVVVLTISAIGVSGTNLSVVQAANQTTNTGIVYFNRGTASLTIKGNSGQTLVGKKFNVYKLFYAENAKGMESINYTWNPSYKTALQNVVGERLKKTPSDVTEYEVIDYIQSINNNKVEGADKQQNLEGRYSDYRYFVEDVRDEIVRLGGTGDQITVNYVAADNSIQLAGLEYGYYIVDEVTNNQGSYSSNSLCMVDTANPDASINIKSDYPSVIKKIQEDDASDAITDADRWNDIGDYEIGQTVPYKFTSTLTNINGYHTYYWAWHDQMAEELNFNKDSVKIQISDGTKTYTLGISEFETVEKTSDGCSFEVRIADIKKIVDREFNKLDALGHNTYGQTVTLTYNATLNDKAAEATGRPGFENRVRLEFSNDSDSDNSGETGITPWDTVVCFTYQLDVLKTNNHDKVLEGAKFRLYSDKDCENEVYVKAGNDGYIVINRDTLGGTDHTGGSAPAEAVEMVSAEDGTFTIYGLDGGIYYLKETDAPDGYRELLDPIVLQVIPTITTDRDNYVKGDGATEKTLQKLEAKAHIESFFDGLTHVDDQELNTDVSSGMINLTVINQVGMQLPTTGSSAVLLLMIVGGILVGIILVVDFSVVLSKGKLRKKAFEELEQEEGTNKNE